MNPESGVNPDMDLDYPNDRHPDDFGADLSDKDPSSRKRLTYDDLLLKSQELIENSKSL